MNFRGVGGGDDGGERCSRSCRWSTEERVEPVKTRSCRSKER